MTCRLSGRTGRSQSCADDERVAPADEHAGQRRGELEGDEQPRRALAHQARYATVSSRRRSRCRATVVVRSRTSERFPGRRDVAGDPPGAARLPPGSRARPRSRPSRPASPRCRRPGPAIPVIPTPTSAPNRSRRAVGERLGDLVGDRAVALDQLGVDAGERDLGGVGVRDHPPGEVRARTPARSVSRAAIRPPVHDSATAIVRSREQRHHLLVDRLAGEREQRVGVAAGDEVHERLVGLLRGRLVARGDLDLPPAQAGGDLERVELEPLGLGGAERRGDLRLRDAEQPHHPALGSVGAPAIAARNASVRDRVRPHRLELARRPRAARRSSGPRRRPAGRRARARCRPARAPSRPRGSPPACGSRSAAPRRRGSASA